MEEQANGRVTTAQMMVYVSEQFDKIRAEMCDGFAKLENQLADAQSRFVTHNEVNAQFALLESRLDAAVGERNKLIQAMEKDLTEIDRDVEGLKVLVYKAVGIGMVAGIVLGAVLSNALGHVWPA